ncbi:MAG: dynamin family protein [Bryobacterales bacterium]|nr:dynamin family protein [Bryobacterales bacterium]
MCTDTENAASAIILAGELHSRYQIHSIQPLLAACRAAAETEFPVAVVGRFKAGKSSFLNRFIGEEVLPVGVTPVTSVITRIRFGEKPQIIVHFLNSQALEGRIEELPFYVTETHNPENARKVDSVTVETPSLRRFPGICLVDTPGMESVFGHNTETARKWLPNVGMALVAVGVDPPLTQQDAELLRRLREFTPRITVLLTKFDLLDAAEARQVVAFVEQQLRRQIAPPPEVFPYSAKPGFEELGASLERNLLRPLVERLNDERIAVLNHKTAALMNECEDSLLLALAAAEATEAQREQLKTIVLGEKESIEEFKMQLRLTARHAAGNSRRHAAAILEAHTPRVEKALVEELERLYPEWRTSLARVISSFQAWLERSLAEKLSEAQDADRAMLLRPVEQTAAQLGRALQDFRNRLSERAEKAYGIRPRTTKIEIQAVTPQTPDVRIGHVFDRNWELLSPILPMSLFGAVIYRHLAKRKAPYEVYKNISRLTTQWEESTGRALESLLSEAYLRVEEWMSTLDGLLSRNSAEIFRIREDLGRLRAVRASFGARTPSGGLCRPVT